MSVSGPHVDRGPVCLSVGGMYSHSMTPDTAGLGRTSAAGDVMASVDDDGATERLVIADVSRDDAWVMLPLSEAATLADWR